jgi:DNA-binding NtrC family response regulator
MAEVFETVRTVAPTDVPVLIKGETGTGKELVAKAIHSLSTRCERAMVCVNSASLNDSLLEAELFGHVKGAFTGAISNKRGRLEASHKGTLFLDEIGQMSLRFQTKLLRFLQEGTFEPVGSEETRKVDVRLIAATNKDLREEIREGRFLSDLLYRIEVISINVPPLRSRKDDIPVLVNHFLRLFAAKYGKKITAVQAEAMEAMVRYPWPGNVRELENCIARAVILSKGSLIGLADVPERVRSRDAPARLGTGEKHLLALPEQGLSIREMERELVISTLEICSGNKTLAADRLGISRKALYEKMERYGIEG